MRELIIAVALSASAPAFADDADALARRLAGLSVDNMAVAYACRSAIGEGHYRLARTMAIENGVVTGMSRSDAVLVVSDLDKKIREEVASSSSETNAKDCLDRLGDITFDIRVALARLQKISS